MTRHFTEPYERSQKELTAQIVEAFEGLDFEASTWRVQGRRAPRGLWADPWKVKVENGPDRHSDDWSYGEIRLVLTAHGDISDTRKRWYYKRRQDGRFNLLALRKQVEKQDVAWKEMIDQHQENMTIRRRRQDFRRDLIRKALALVGLTPDEAASESGTQLERTGLKLQVANQEKKAMKLRLQVDIETGLSHLELAKYLRLAQGLGGWKTEAMERTRKERFDQRARDKAVEGRDAA